MRILYGVCAVGMGHATRSRVVVDHLRRRGHEVFVATSGAAYDLFRSRARADGVVRVAGASLVYGTGGMSLERTIVRNFARLPELLAANEEAWRAARAHRPDAVVTDYSTFAGMLGPAEGLPTMSIDNQHVLPRCAHPSDVLDPHRARYRELALLVEASTAPCDRYVVTSFFRPPVLARHAASTVVVPPILRDEVLAYASAGTDAESFLAPLEEARGARFVVYGASPRPTAPHVRLRPFDERSFVEDLRTCRGVVANGGMSTIGEALALGKPVYAIPVAGKYEQSLNAAYVARLGYGATSPALDAETLRAFVALLPEAAARIRSRPQHDGNARLLAAVDAFARGSM